MLARDGVVLLRSVVEPELLGLAEQFGSIVEPGVGMDPGLTEGGVYSVRPRNDDDGIRDEHGHVILSTTRREFRFHTDAYNRSDPPRYVFLLRIDSDPTDSTPSYISDAYAALERLSERQRTVLASPAFASALGYVPLVDIVDDVLRFRFNPAEIDRWGPRLPPGPSEEVPSR